ncbi:MAG: hypothetical protein JWO98_157 [Frankiales bacterium]|nr:hypothetical protein [Frankiales bacterium]
MAPRSHVIRLRLIFTAFTALTLVLLSSFTSPASAMGQFPDAGWWGPGSSVRIYDGPEIRVDWTTNYVYPYQDEPLYIYYDVIYINKTDHIVYLSCSGWSDPALSKQHVYRDGRYIGYIAAEKTLCSQDPNWNASLGPQRRVASWAIFHNVPWNGDRVSLEWGNLGQSSYENPYAVSLGGSPPPNP